MSGISAVVESGSSFTVTCTPSADVFASAGSASTFTNISFSFTAAAIAMNLGGTTPDPKGGDDLLTGQQCSASLVGVPSSPAYPTTYAWSVSAGGGTADVFKTYNDQAAANPLVLLSAADLAGAGLSFYDKNQETIVIQCKATISAADGKSSQVVTVQSQPVAVLKPSAKWTAYSSGLFVDQAGGYGAKEFWNPATITVPGPFTGGTGCFAQMITPNRQASRTLPPGTPLVYPATYYLKMPVTNSDGTSGWTLPTTGLDTSFPYPFGTTTNPNGTTSQVSANYTWDVSSKGISGDAPTSQYLPPVVPGDMGGTNWYTATTTDAFTTWVMYKPTNASAVWVPLQNLNWSTNLTVSNTSGVWAGASGSGVTTATAGTDTVVPPQWTTINNASVFQMRP